MLSKKYILVIALAGLVFSCQKENIRPNTCATESVEDSSNTTVWKSSNSNGDTLTPIVGFSSEVINTGKTDANLVRENDSEITDPNNDDDRNKKKKN